MSNSLEPNKRWQKGADGLFRPTPPYVVGEVVPCEGCGRLTRVNEYAARHQWVYGECRPCGEAEDAYVRSGE